MNRLLRKLFVPGLLVCLVAFTTGCDEDGPTGTDNIPPTADAGTDQTVAVDDEVTLDGSGSSDPDDDQLSYMWTLDTPDGSSAALSNSSVVQPTFTPDVAGTYTGTLTVSDGNGEQDSDQVEITADQSQQPVVIDSDVTSDRTLSNRFSDPDQVDYRVASTVGVRSDAQLVIEAGVQIVFESGTGLFVADNAGSLVATGTASEPIVMTAQQPQPGFWRGIAFFSNNVQNELTHVEIYYSGGDDYNVSGTDVPANVTLDTGARLTLANSTVSNSAGYGLYANPDVDLTGFSSNTFENNAEAPVYIPATAAGEIDGATSLSNNDEAYVRVFDRDVTDDVTLTRLADGVPYQFNGTTGIEGGAQLTIEAGVNMVFESGAGLWVEDNASSLVAVGTASAPIVMTAQQQQPGFWRGIAFFSNNVQNELAHVEIAYGGGDDYNIRGTDVPANVTLETGARLRLANSNVNNSANYGLYANPGVDLSGFSSNTFENNAEAPMYIPATAAGEIDGATSFANNDEAYARVYDQAMTDDATLTRLADGVPYQFTGTTGIEGGAQLTIEAGVNMVFESDAGLSVEDDASSLVAVGTASEPIVMTAQQQQPGFWRGIAFFSNNVQNELTHVEIAYGGSDDDYNISGSDVPANIVLDNNGRLTLANSLIRDSNGWGVHLNTGATLEASNNTYRNNADGDVNN